MQRFDEERECPDLQRQLAVRGHKVALVDQYSCPRRCRDNRPTKGLNMDNRACTCATVVQSMDRPTFRAYRSYKVHRVSSTSLRCRHTPTLTPDLILGETRASSDRFAAGMNTRPTPEK